MKRTLLFFVISLIVLSGCSVIAQTTEQPDLTYVIVASRNGIEQEYKTGTRFLIKFKSDSSIQKTRGFFAGVSEGKIVMLPKKTSNEVVLIPPDSVLLLRRIRPTQRIGYAATGITLIGVGAAVLNRAANTSGSTGAAVLVIPVIGAGVYFLCVIPITLVIEKLYEKKKTNGWTFSIRQQ